MELVDVDSAVADEGCDAFWGEKRDIEAAVAEGSRKVAEHGAEPMILIELVVAVGDQDQAARRVHASAEETERVERCLVRPVSVLDHHHRGQRKLVEQRRVPLVPVPALERSCNRRLARRHVVERPKRAGRRERVTRPPEHAHAAGKIGAEGAHEARLAHAGLPADEDDPARAGARLVQQGAELRQEFLRSTSSTGSRYAWAIRTANYPCRVKVANRTGEEFEERIRALETSLSPRAVRSYETRGRAVREEECSVRTPFQRDRDRLVHSKPFRRLKGKTQVFIDPEGDHYRTRMTHTLETTAISRVVARALRLNEDLVEAIGLGHDTGHTPFGHAGEDALDAALRERFDRRFRHNEQSLRIARSLNLTHEVCEGILTHTGPDEPATLEGKIVRLVDRVAYINHDIDDALRYGLLRESDLPREEIAVLGRTGSERIDTLVHDIVEVSEGAGDIRQSDDVGEAMLSLRSFMFERVYLGPQARPEHVRAHETVRRIFDRLVEEPERLPPGVDDLPTRITDYVAGMTDRFALAYARER